MSSPDTVSERYFRNRPIHPPAPSLRCDSVFPFHRRTRFGPPTPPRVPRPLSPRVSFCSVYLDVYRWPVKSLSSNASLTYSSFSSYDTSMSVEYLSLTIVPCLSSFNFPIVSNVCEWKDSIPKEYLRREVSVGSFTGVSVNPNYTRRCKVYLNSQRKSIPHVHWRLTRVGDTFRLQCLQRVFCTLGGLSLWQKTRI